MITIAYQKFIIIIIISCYKYYELFRIQSSMLAAFYQLGDMIAIILRCV